MINTGKKSADIIPHQDMHVWPNPVMLPRMSTLEITYRSASLQVAIADNKASLTINGLERDHKPLPEPGQTLRLSSTVQTDYEWHEFIEAVLVSGTDEVKINLYANNQLLGDHEVARA